MKIMFKYLLTKLKTKTKKRTTIDTNKNRSNVVWLNM